MIKCAFSIEPGCFKKEGENEFMNVPKLFIPSLLSGLKNLAIFFLPQWIIEHIPVPLVEFQKTFAFLLCQTFHTFDSIFSFIPRAMDQWFRSFVRINKASRSKDFQSNDLFQTLLQIQEKNSKI